MTVPDLLAALADPTAYPRPGPVEVRQTHISAVFLVGDTVYKVRKPVNLGFVDFSTLARRKADCDAEVRLNRRLAPGVYRGVVPITAVNGRVQMNGPGEPVEWAVEMERLPDDATLLEWIARDELTTEHIQRIARRVAEFHRTAERGMHISRFGRFEVVAGNARENFAQTTDHVGRTVSRAIYDRCRERTERALAVLRDLIDARAARGLPCDTHGDLHLDHVYLFPDRSPPDDLVIIDCIEFADRFRFADPVTDLAFLVMDLEFRGRRDLARACGEAYFAAAGDDEGRALLPFYAAYRAVVRAKVEGLQAASPELRDDERDRRRDAARSYWHLAWSNLEEPGRRPAVVLVGGLPGTGKSTLARNLAAAAGFTVIRSDEIRKELAGMPATEKAAGIYTPEWTERTYAECLRRVRDALDAGRRVIVDATFAREAHRAHFLEEARQARAAGVFLDCRADPALVRERLRARSGDASDADERVYEDMISRWEPASRSRGQQLVEIDTTDAVRALEEALRVLREMGVASS